MKKREIVFLGMAAATSLAGMLPAGDAMAAMNCNTSSVLTNADVPNCSGSGGFTQQLVNFSGSAGVRIAIDDTAAGVSVCTAHVGGRNKYGTTTNGGPMQVVTGNAIPTTPVASAVGSTGQTAGCQ